MRGRSSAQLERARRGKDEGDGLLWAGLLFLFVAFVFAIPAVEKHWEEFLSPPFPDPHKVFRAPAGDFWIYYLGSRAWLEGVNPYDNSDIRSRMPEVFSVHPNPYYAEWVKQNFAGNIGITKGYVATPVNLWLLAPLAKLPFVAATVTWFAFSVLIFFIVATAFTMELTSGWPAKRRWAAVLIVVTVFVAVDGNVGQSLFLGQIDSLYLGAMALSVYLMSTQVQVRHRELWAGIALGLAGAVKIFPGFMAIFLLWTGVQAAYRSSDHWSGRLGTLTRHSGVRAAAAAFAAFLCMLGITRFWIAPPLWDAWWQKLPRQLAVMTPEAHHLPDAVHYVRYWLAALGFESISQRSATVFFLPVNFGLIGIAAQAFQRAFHFPSLRLPAFGLVIALMPSVFYFNINYCVILMIPLIAGAFLSLQRPKRIALFGVGFLLINYQLVEDVLSAISPALLDRWLNRAALLHAWARFLPARPEMEPILEPVVSPANLCLGYPGTVVILIGCWLVLRDAIRSRGPGYSTTPPTE